MYIIIKVVLIIIFSIIILFDYAALVVAKNAELEDHKDLNN